MVELHVEECLLVLVQQYETEREECLDAACKDIVVYAEDDVKGEPDAV